MGPSGSGKTTLLNLMGGLDTPNGGLHRRRRGPHRPALGQPSGALAVPPHRLRLPALPPAAGADGGEERRAAAAADAVGARATGGTTWRRRSRSSGLEHRAKHYPRQLSGGQEQRVGIARAIVTDPTLLLCDEPTGDLDRRAGDEILDLLQALNAQHGKTIVMVTHDARAAARARRTLHLSQGTLTTEASA